jgi:2-phospho-L-lactate guanylyltransferase
VRKQGTIKTFDPQTRTGVLFDDQKTEYAFGPDSYRESGLREFRMGQRVKFTVQGEAIRELTIVSF